MATTWTVVYRTSRYANAFRPTGFEGTWDEAAAHARTVWEDLGLGDDAEVFYVTTTDTSVLVDSGRYVRINPTAEAKAAAKARQAQVDAILARHEDGLARHGYSPLMGFARRIGATTPAEVAAYAVDNGMDYAAISRTQW